MFMGKEKSLNIFFHILHSESIKDLTIVFNHNPARLSYYINLVKASECKNKRHRLSQFRSITPKKASPGFHPSRSTKPTIY